MADNIKIVKLKTHKNPEMVMNQRVSPVSMFNSQPGLQKRSSVANHSRMSDVFNFRQPKEDVLYKSNKRMSNMKYNSYINSRLCSNRPTTGKYSRIADNSSLAVIQNNAQCGSAEGRRKRTNQTQIKQISQNQAKFMKNNRLHQNEEFTYILSSIGTQNDGLKGVLTGKVSLLEFKSRAKRANGLNSRMSSKSDHPLTMKSTHYTGEGK